MANSLLTKMPYPNTPLMSSAGAANINYVWYEFIRAIATEARTSDTDGQFVLTGSADEVQLIINAFTTQSTVIFLVNDSSGNATFSVDNHGNVSLLGQVDGRSVSADGTLLDVISVGVDSTVKGRASGDGDGVIEDLTGAEIRAIINVENGADVTDALNVTQSLSVATIDAVTVASTDAVLVKSASELGALRTVTAQSIADLGSGVPVLVDSATASASASIGFTTLTSDYQVYLLTISNLAPATDATDLYCRVGNGSYDSGGTDYMWIEGLDIMSSGGVLSRTTLGDYSDSEITIASNLSNTSNEDFSGVIYIYAPTAATATNMSWNGTYLSSSSELVVISGSGKHITAAASDRVEILMSSGNITSGEFRLYGLRNA